MAWKLNDLIYLYLTNVRLSDLENTNNPLGLCDSLLDKNEQELLIAFSPLKQEVFDAFTKIVSRNSKYITTLGQVLNFVNFCAEDRSTYPFSILRGDFSADDLLGLTFPDDLLVIIELED